MATGLEEFYSSEFYKHKVDDLIQDSSNKRKAPEHQFNVVEDHERLKFEEVKNLIRKGIMDKKRPNPPEAVEAISLPQEIQLPPAPDRS